MWRTTEADWKNVVNVNLVWMKRESKRDEYWFEISRWYGDSKEIIATKVKWIEGNLTKVVAGGYDYTDEHWATKHSKTLTFFLDDWENVMKYWTWYNIVSRNIIFGLASIEWKIGKITLSPYRSKSGYRNMRVTNNGEDVLNKFDYEKEIKWRCKYSEEFQKTSYVELDKWIEETLVPMINEKIDFANKNVEDFVKEEEKKEEKKEDVIDDLPF